MTLDVISSESSLMKTSNEVSLTERKIIFLALGGRYKVCLRVRSKRMCLVFHYEENKRSYVSKHHEVPEKW